MERCGGLAGPAAGEPRRRGRGWGSAGLIVAAALAGVAGVGVGKDASAAPGNLTVAETVDSG